MNHRVTKARMIFQASELDQLIGAIRSENYRIIGPVIQDGAITLTEIERADDLPVGKTDQQSPGKYRISDRSDEAFFGYHVGSSSMKNFLHVPRSLLYQAHRDSNGDVSFRAKPSEVPRFAFIGMRSCDLHALEILDKVLLEGPEKDESYAALRKEMLIVAVNCTEMGATCFCDSMGTGPAVSSNCDILLTEVLGDDYHFFAAESGSEAGRRFLEKVSVQKADEFQAECVNGMLVRASNPHRRLDSAAVYQLLTENLEHREWGMVAARCLSCGNCTMVCPTCFGTSVQESSDLDGKLAERYRMWDSCFSVRYSYIHGGAVRPTVRARYRQWLLHKFATWQDQFGTSGCTGCGRCITWCPVGIDVTEEIRVLQETTT